jgi:hypothetical protein
LEHFVTKEEKKILLLDYEKTLAYIDKADGQLFQIRGWALGFCSAVVAFAVTQNAALILGGNCVLILAFCLLELIYKSFHDDAIARGHRLESIIKASLDPASPLPPDYVFGIGHQIQVPSLRRVLQILWRPTRWHVGALYVGLLALTAISAVYLRWLR